MWRCLILVPILLLVLAHSVQAEEVEAQAEGIDPARVAKLLLSSEEGERAHGAALLRARMQQGGDLQTWLVAMARAQAEWADAEDRLVERWIGEVLHGTPERAAKARRLLAAIGREATQRLLQALKDVQTLLPHVVVGQTRQQGAPTPQLPVIPRPESAEPPPPPPPAEERPQRVPVTAPAAVGLLQARVVEVPRAELLGSLASDAFGAGATDLQPLAHDRPVLVLSAASLLFERAAALPEARLRTGRLAVLSPGPGIPLVEGDVVRYRSRARRTKGAWAVDTDTLLRGLGVTVRVFPMDDSNLLQVEARYVSLPEPLPTEQVRPAGDVEPLELDRPEWEAASMKLSTPTARAREGVVAFFPGLVPDKVVVVSIRLRPLQAEAAAREQGK